MQWNMDWQVIQQAEYFAFEMTDDNHINKGTCAYMRGIRVHVREDLNRMRRAIIECVA